MSDLRVVFDRFIEADRKLSVIRAARDRASDAAHLIRRRCGNCTKWMKTRACPREHGLGSQGGGPSCEGWTCSEYVEEKWVRDHYNELMAESERLLASVANATAASQQTTDAAPTQS